MRELASLLIIYPQVIKNVEIVDRSKAKNDKDVQRMITLIKEQLSDEGRVIVRESGTEHVVRVMVEAGSIELCEEFVDRVIKVLCRKGYVV